MVIWIIPGRAAIKLRRTSRIIRLSLGRDAVARRRALSMGGLLGFGNKALNSHLRIGGGLSSRLLMNSLLLLLQFSYSY
jgi:hypothetical protein